MTVLHSPILQASSNGKYIGTKKTGGMFANCDSCSEPNAKYYFYLINRPILVLKCEQGFVGYKSAAASNVLECNKATYETIVVERAENGVVYFKGSTGDSKNIFSCTGAACTSENHFARHPNHNYTDFKQSG